MNRIQYGIVLAAGCGTRSSPLSSYLPKPLFPIGESRLIDFSLNAVTYRNLTPIVAVRGYCDKISSYLESKGNNYVLLRSHQTSTNLLDTVANCSPIITDKSSFLWIGAGMWFSRHADIESLIENHLDGNYFCSMFIQDEVQYKPKLIMHNGKLVKFIVDDVPKIKSSPTCFVVHSEFINYCQKYTEQRVFQKAIEENKSFNITELDSQSLEVHSIEDYRRLNRILYPTGYTDSKSSILASSIEKSYIYGSKISGSSISNSIIIDADISHQTIESRLIAGNSINIPLL